MLIFVEGQRRFKFCDNNMLVSREPEVEGVATDGATLCQLTNYARVTEARHSHKLHVLEYH